MKMGGYAAGRIAGVLKKKDADLADSQGGFFVKDREGPLVDGESERAAAWAKEIAQSKKIARN